MEKQPEQHTVDLVFGDLSLLTTSPWRLTDIASWHEHIPFAFWLMRQLKPSCFVELGVHKGDSYSAICQTVKDAGLQTRCFGIDTWQGEVHAGRYDDSIWQEYSTYHRQHFAGFSNLIRSTFDEALQYFPDGDVDLIHIDGRHFYQDVKHDFESWLPKLSPRAAVLFHDINVREREFGVWKYWDELRIQYPGRTFSFVHGHGLGLLFPGEQPPALATYLGELGESDTQYVRAAFAAMGKSVSRQAEVNRLSRLLLTTEQRAIEAESRSSALVGQLEDTAEKIKALERDFAAATESDLRSAQQVKSESTRIGELLGEHQRLIKENFQLKSESTRNGELLSEQERLIEENFRLRAECLQLKGQIDSVLQSRSWRALGPLRGIATGLKPNRSSLTQPGATVHTAETETRDLAFESSLVDLRNSPLFDRDYYLSANADVQSAGVDPAEHYLMYGWHENRDPSASFSTSHYLEANPDVASAQVNPLIHYIRYGQLEGRPLKVEVITDERRHLAIPDRRLQLEAEATDIRNSGLFDEDFYRSMYPDINPAPVDPILHYCEQGWREGRNPSDDFDTAFYLGTYDDIAWTGTNPFWHYVKAGAFELRHALPDQTSRLEDDAWFGSIETTVDLIAMYGSVDWPALRKGRTVAIGHPQPALPLEAIGFYDPVAENTLRVQAQMARRHGIHGFCFDLEANHLASPLATLLAAPEIALPFCIRISSSQGDLTDSELATLMQACSDNRFICTGSRPLIIVALGGSNSPTTTDLRRLRQHFAARGMMNPFLIGCPENLEAVESMAGADELLDAFLDLPPLPIPGETGPFRPLEKAGVAIIPYRVIASHGVSRAATTHIGGVPLYQAITLGRDDTANAASDPLIYTRFHLRDYRRWLDAAINASQQAHPAGQRMVFLNSWNDWKNGSYLEPDRRSGFGRLNETSRALVGLPQGEILPKVSVVVPNYNHAPFLKRRLDSIYGQTYKNIEVILLDDCSKDTSRSILDEYASAHPEITRKIYNEQNSGGAFRQWARGIKAASGDLVWIAESDDFCDDRFLEVLVKCFKDESVMLAYSQCVFVSKDGTTLPNEFKHHVADLACASKWEHSFVETAHNEVRQALGIKNTIPNASGAIFRRPIDMALLDDESWLSMVVAGDWVFYLHAIRGGKLAYTTETTNFFRRYEGSAAEVTYTKESFYREVGIASRTVASLYKVPVSVLEQCRTSFKALYEHRLGQNDSEFSAWYNFEAVLKARAQRLPNVMVCTMGFFPGGAEILPIRMVNELKRQGLGVLLFNAGLNPREDGVRRMLRNDVPLVETSDPATMKSIMAEFGIEALNTHQWHIQKYPLQMPDVFSDLNAHVASLHGMIEHGDAFGVTREQLVAADHGVTTWVYTADKNIVPFIVLGLHDASSQRFVKLPNGMQPPVVVPRSRAELGITEDSFVLCCVSRAIPDKGWAELIQSVDRARQLTARDIRIILVGNGPVYDEYSRDGVPDFVHLAGFSEDSVGFYAAADMGVMLTRFKSESFPLTILDCLFAGKPYIATDVGEIRNMLTTDEQIAGGLIELAEWEVPIEAAAQLIARFATDSQAYSHAMAQVKRVSDRYRIDVVAAQYIDLFKKDCSIPRQAAS
jgi:glycosyltransferase involved in cell wall biosynthesis